VGFQSFEVFEGNKKEVFVCDIMYLYPYMFYGDEISGLFLLYELFLVSNVTKKPEVILGTDRAVMSKRVFF